MDQERFSEVVRGAEDLEFTFHLRSYHIGLLYASLRLMLLHPQVSEFGSNYKDRSEYLMDCLLRFLYDMGFTQGEIDKEENSTEPERFIHLIETCEKGYDLELEIVDIMIMHGSIRLAFGHPQALYFSEHTREIADSIMNVLCSMMSDMGFTEEEIHFMNTEVE